MHEPGARVDDRVCEDNSADFAKTSKSDPAASLACKPAAQGE